jgi:hypothetical protein
VGLKLQLSETQYQQAADRYNTIGEWLGASGSPLSVYKSNIYPQGSLRIGTTVKPRGRDEFDLDLVCQFQVNPETVSDPIALLDMVEKRLREHETYRPMVERKNRCIRVTYANQFHLDILPACPRPSADPYGKDAVVVPDCDADDWKPSNPRGYAAWYESRATEAVTQFKRAHEPLPEQQSHDEISTLNRIVQLLKRRRDISFQQTPKIAPISIVLTTLAAQTYGGQSSVSEGMESVLNGIVGVIPHITATRLKVLNPTNSAEDLSERWDANPEGYLAFVKWVGALRVRWDELMSARGIQNVKSALQTMFGERVAREVVMDHIREFEAPRQAGALAVERGTGRIVPATVASSTPIVRNTFYGDD